MRKRQGDVEFAAAGTKPPRGPKIRKAIGIILIMAIVWGVIWLIFYSGYADPVIAAVGPWYDSAVTAVSDPLGVDWAGHAMMIAAIIVPHMALIMFLLDEQ